MRLGKVNACLTKTVEVQVPALSTIRYVQMKTVTTGFAFCLLVCAKEAFQSCLCRTSGTLQCCYRLLKNHQNLLPTLQLVMGCDYLYTTPSINIGGDPVQLNYSFDDDNHGDDGFGPVSEHFNNDDFSVMNNQTDDVFGDNFAAANTYRYLYH